MTALVKPRDIGWYGFRPDLPDRRDKVFAPRRALLAAPPPPVDLRPLCCPVMDQGDGGVCSAHAITEALRFLLIKQGKPDIQLSRLQLYYDERTIEGTVRSDAGAELRNGLKCAAKIGVAHESLWPYNLKKLTSKPTRKVYADALKFTALTYERVEVNVAHIKAALSSGFPVIIGISIFDAFEGDAVAQTGMVPMPGATDAPLGGHAMLTVGFGQKPGCFTVMNSWNTDWGDKGFCYIPEEYLGNPDLGSDYWTITSLKVS